MRKSVLPKEKIEALIREGKDVDSIAQVAYRYEGLFIIAYFGGGKPEQKKRVEQIRNKINELYEKFHKPVGTRNQR